MQNTWNAYKHFFCPKVSMKQSSIDWMVISVSNILGVKKKSKMCNLTQRFFPIKISSSNNTWLLHTREGERERKTSFGIEKRIVRSSKFVVNPPRFAPIVHT